MIFMLNNNSNKVQNIHTKRISIHVICIYILIFCNINIKISIIQSNKITFVNNKLTKIYYYYHFNTCQ